jgi:hypothetical protein
MEQINTATCGAHAIAYRGGLPDDRADWPEDARTAYREVLRELDIWCRQNDSSAVNNGWVAEQAIRQTW